MSAPRHCAPNDLLGGVRDVGGFVDQRGILAPQLEQDRCQILGGCSRNNLSRAGAAGEENEIEGKFEKLRGLFAMAGHRRDGLRLEIFRHQIDQQRARCRERMLSLSTQQLPAASAVIAGRSSNKSGPLKGPMINATP